MERSKKSIIKKCILLSSLAEFSATRPFSLNTETKVQQKWINFEFDFNLFLSLYIPLTEGFWINSELSVTLYNTNKTAFVGDPD